MYRNLKAEMSRAGLSGIRLAEWLNISTTELYYKLNGKHEWKLKQMMATQKLLNELLKSDLTLEYLFSRGEENDR